MDYYPDLWLQFQYIGEAITAYYGIHHTKKSAKETTYIFYIRLADSNVVECLVYIIWRTKKASKNKLFSKLKASTEQEDHIYYQIYKLNFIATLFDQTST